MKDGLREINELTGVWGSLIFNNQGEVIMNATPPGLNKSALENITQHIIELVSTAGDQIENLSETVLYYSQKKLFIVVLEKAVLVVICTPSVDIFMLRMIVNGVRMRWDGDKKVQKLLQKNFIERL